MAKVVLPDAFACADWGAIAAQKRYLSGRNVACCPPRK